MIYILTAIHEYSKHIDKFFSALNHQDYGNIVLVIILDGYNGKKKFSCKYPVKYILGNGKLYWGGSMARGINYIMEIAQKNDYLLTINTDCVFENSFVRKLLSDVTRFRNKCMVGTPCIDSNGKLIDAGWTVNWKNGSIQGSKLTSLNDFLKDQNHIDYDFLSSKGTIVPIDIVKKVGNYNFKHFPHYASDFEYSNRIKQYGYQLRISKQTWLENDTKHTGISGQLHRDINFRELTKLLFSRKSQINIRDHFYLIFYCCPVVLQPLNYLYLVGKVLYLISFLRLFYPFRPTLVKIRARLLSS